MAKNRIQALVLLTILVLPLLIYILFRYISKPVFNKIPYQYMETVSGDSIIPQIRQIRLNSIDEDLITTEDILGKIYLIDFFSIRDTLLTTVLHGNLKSVLNNINEADYIGMLSVYTGDTLTPELITYMETEFKGDGKQWKAVWGSQNDVLSLGAEQLGIGEMEKKWDSLAFKDQVLPFTSQTIALIDKSGKVRQYYVATDLAEIRKINEDLQALTVIEYPDELRRNQRRD